MAVGKCKHVTNEAFGDEVTQISTWKVENGVLAENIYSDESMIQAFNIDIATQIELWNRVYEVLPRKWMDKYITQFELVSDGKDEILAGVNPMDESNHYWSFLVDVKDATNTRAHSLQDDFNHTLLHEFGHILTLNNSQIEPTDMKWQKDDLRYLTSEGLAFEESYINHFVKQFWYGNLLDEWDDIQRIRSEAKRIDRLYELYEQYPNHFMNDYSAESPEEDIAESWYFFVKNEKPSPKNIANKKILFFYQFPELIELRKEIRSRFNHR